MQEKKKSIFYHVEENIAVVSMDTPENFNAMTEELLEALDGALARAADDPAVRVVVIRGEGRAFCAGGDIRAMKRGVDEGDAHALARIVRRAGDAARRLRAIRKPVIASVHGSAAGAGCSLALLCDFRVVSEETRFIEAFVNLGLVPDMGGTYVLSRYVGLGRLTEYLMTGRPLGAREALEMGLVNAVVPRDALDAETRVWAKKLVALPAESHARIKSLINQTLFADMGLCLEREEEYQDALASTADYREGVTAFLEKRAPRFGG